MWWREDALAVLQEVYQGMDREADEGRYLFCRFLLNCCSNGWTPEGDIVL